ncbi:uncharacterized protein LY89DRAFT_163025 [Mollisia scopiformis]|uniref:Uncharacterized protein n=1 Tax=Mollisia scopiformis TaxID=149040 RepID=A0A194XSF3_MOLSC|nr:uncharacterized protein LY89DRAFT_163025 [Mollisia scopiformis]KUJ22969.1 hypothetical protein LY89DRAFT_163025 [Mollisia scopiformis]
MAPYSNINSREDLENESFYRTPAYGPEDIICPGSDIEETPEETRRKRLRYEAQARRYTRGHRPILLSASLRGPFSKESGWTNPWGCQRRKRVQDGRQKGLEATISSRAESQHSWRCDESSAMPTWERELSDLRQRISHKEYGISIRSTSQEKETAHGMGYANPAEVLAWQARAGAVERIAVGDRSVHPDHRKEQISGEQSMITSTQDRPTFKVSEVGESSEAQAADSMINHYMKTPHAGNDSDFTRGTKRASDSQWLMGSYVSKRARWDGPVHSSPTPAPESIALRDRERRYASAGSGQEKGIINPRQPKLGALRSLSERAPRNPTIKEALQHTPIFSAQVENQMINHSNPTGSGFSSMPVSFTSPQAVADQEMDKLQGLPQEPRSGSRTSSKRTPKKTSRNIIDLSSNLEQDDLIAITPCPKIHGTPTTSGSNLRMKASSATLPKLPRSGDDNFTALGDDSFVSEVAPSSRNLEKFHFKKRKRRTKSTEHDKSTVDNIQDVAPDITSTREEVCIPVNVANPKHTGPDELQDLFNNEGSQDVEHLDLKHGSSDQEDAGDVDDLDDMEDSRLLEAPEDLEITTGLGSKENSICDQSAQQIDPVEGAEGKNKPTTYSEPQLLLAQNEEPAPINNEADGSWNLGEMSFLRAVLRAADSTNNTPSNKQDSIPTQGRPLLSLNEAENSSRHSDYLAKFEFGASHDVPDSSYQRSSSLPLPAQTCKASDHSVEEESRYSDHHSHTKVDFSHILKSNSSLEKLPRKDSPSPEDTSFQSPGDENSQESDQFTESKTNPNQLNAASSPHGTFPPTSIPLTKPSQDPNDFSTQSYNTTPFKLQRSVRPPHSKRIMKLSDFKAQSSGPCEAISNEKQDTMELIQLELSQICPSSRPQSVDLSERGNDDEDGDSFEQLNEANVGVEDRDPPTRVRGRDSNESSVDHSESFCESVESQLEGQTAPPGEQSVEVQPEQLEAPAPDDTPAALMEPGATGTVANDVTQEKINSDKGSEEPSETSWEGCGPQSPWATEENEIIIVHAPENKDQSEAPHSVESDLEISLLEDNVLEADNELDISSEWQRLEGPQTPENSGSKSFNGPIPLTETPKPEEMISLEALTSTQLLVDAATKNPWTSSRKRPTSLKATKRVSFGNLSSHDGEDSQPIVVKFGAASPPPPERPSQEDVFNSGTTSVPKFQKHFKRQFKKLLPDNVASPVNSSPALAAQAEAFIAADRETSIEQEFSTNYKTPTRHLKPRSETDSNTAWRQQSEADIPLPSYSRFERSPSPPVNASLAGFDMEAALGEAGNFLEDWSVDSELKKAKESGTSRGQKSNGYRRRRLFGLV